MPGGIWGQRRANLVRKQNFVGGIFGVLENDKALKLHLDGKAKVVAVEGFALLHLRSVNFGRESHIKPLRVVAQRLRLRQRGL